MSSLRTFALTSFMFLAPALTAAAGEASLTQQFATCAGRLSAQMEFEWLLTDPAADQTEQERAAMIALLDSVAAPEDRRRALAIRIEAKHAQSVLLTRAHFNDDPSDAAWALDRAAVELGACRALILS